MEKLIRIGINVTILYGGAFLAMKLFGHSDSQYIDHLAVVTTGWVAAMSADVQMMQS